MRLISVTEALAPFSKYDGISPAVLEIAAQKGNRVHAKAAAYVTKSFQVQDLIFGDMGYWVSLQTWIDDSVEEVIAVEPELKDERLGVVGHPDLAAKVHGMLTVVDWKTPAQIQKTWRPQLAAYCYLAELAYKKKFSGMVVQPDKEGGPAKATPFTASGIDLQVFFSSVNCARYFNP